MTRWRAAILGMAMTTGFLLVHGTGTYLAESESTTRCRKEMLSSTTGSALTTMARGVRTTIPPEILATRWPEYFKGLHEDIDTATERTAKSIIVAIDCLERAYE